MTGMESCNCCHKGKCSFFLVGLFWRGFINSIKTKAITNNNCKFILLQNRLYFFFKLVTKCIKLCIIHDKKSHNKDKCQDLSWIK